MAKKKAELIAEAEAAGHELTGEETTADLVALLEGEGGEDGAVDLTLGTDPALHVVINGSVVENGVYATEKPRRILHDGNNVEHISELPNGVWVYESR